MMRYVSRYWVGVIVVRHGQSEWNKVRRWAGWTDVRLSQQGINESRSCGRVIKSQHLDVDEVYTSVLTRTILTLNCILDEMDLHYVPVTKTWRLNEKNYGMLEGENKVEMSIKYGEDQVNQWRRSLDVRPPPLQLTDHRHPVHDRRYKYINAALPSSQCLLDVVERLKILIAQEIQPKIQNGKRIMIITHGNVIRGLFYIWFNMGHKQLSKLNFPNATPIIISFDSHVKALDYKIMGNQQEINRKMQMIEDESKIK